MPYRISRLFPGRALPALFIPLFLLPVLFSCSPDKGKDAPPAAAERVAASVPEASQGHSALEGAPAPEGDDAAVNEAFEAAERGDLGAAEKSLRRSLALDASSPVLKGALAKVLALKGKMAFDRGEFASAAAILEEASNLSHSPGIFSMLADARYKSGDLLGAASILERIIGEPGASERLKALYTILGRESLKDGKTDDAAVFLGKASAIDPSDKELAEESAKMERESSFEAGMERREGGHFLVKFEGGENAVAGHLIGLLLEEAYLKIGQDLGHYPEERIEALLYSKEAFRDITRSPSWAGAIYDGRIKIPAGGLSAKTSALEKVIYHEYTHAVVREISGGRAPVWLNEGLAQYEEGLRSAPYARVLAGLSSKGKLGLRELEGSFLGLGAEEAQSAYVISLSAVEYVVREFGFFSVRNMLENLRGGMEMDEAVQAAIGVPYDELERSWAASVARH